MCQNARVGAEKRSPAVILNFSRGIVTYLWEGGGAINIYQRVILHTFFHALGRNNNNEKNVIRKNGQFLNCQN